MYLKWLHVEQLGENCHDACLWLMMHFSQSWRLEFPSWNFQFTISSCSRCMLSNVNKKHSWLWENWGSSFGKGSHTQFLGLYVFLLMLFSQITVQWKSPTLTTYFLHAGNTGKYILHCLLIDGLPLCIHVLLLCNIVMPDKSGWMDLPQV